MEILGLRRIREKSTQDSSFILGEKTLCLPWVPKKPRIPKEGRSLDYIQYQGISRKRYCPKRALNKLECKLLLMKVDTEKRDEISWMKGGKSKKKSKVRKNHHGS